MSPCTQEDMTKNIQNWNEETAMTTNEPAMKPNNRYGVQLPQLRGEQKGDLDEEVTQQEVKEALHDAYEARAQTITFFKLLFMEVPKHLSEALHDAADARAQTITFLKLLFMEVPKHLSEVLNQLFFLPELGTLPTFDEKEDNTFHKAVPLKGSPSYYFVRKLML